MLYRRRVEIGFPSRGAVDLASLSLSGFADPDRVPRDVSHHVVGLVFLGRGAVC